MAKKKKKPLNGKYRFRRFLLMTLLLALVAAGGWFAYEKLDTTAIPTFASLMGPRESESESVSESESESELESETEPESVPEPETEPGSEPEPERNTVSVADWEILLVNADNPMPEGYVPELETVTDSFRVDKRIADSLKLMFADAKASGINLIICSAYRSEEKQNENFNNKKQEYINQGKTEAEAIAVTATIIAKPGTSEHHTGLAVDIVTPAYQSLDNGFETTPAFKWLDENAHKYGFVLRYPKDKVEVTGIIYEPWHYRYVGVENAAIIKAGGICLEEYVAVLNKASTAPARIQSESEAEPESGQEAEPEPAS